MLLEIQMDNDIVLIKNNQNSSFSTNSLVSAECSPSTSSRNSISFFGGSPTNQSNEYTCKKLRC